MSTEDATPEAVADLAVGDEEALAGEAVTIDAVLQKINESRDSDVRRFVVWINCTCPLLKAAIIMTHERFERMRLTIESRANIVEEKRKKKNSLFSNANRNLANSRLRA